MKNPGPSPGRKPNAILRITGRCSPTHGRSFGAFHSHGGTSIAGWFMRENPIQITMMVGGTPFQETLHLFGVGVQCLRTIIITFPCRLLLLRSLSYCMHVLKTKPIRTVLVKSCEIPTSLPSYSAYFLGTRGQLSRVCWLRHAILVDSILPLFVQCHWYC